MGIRRIANRLRRGPVPEPDLLLQLPRVSASDPAEPEGFVELAPATLSNGLAADPKVWTTLSSREISLSSFAERPVPAAGYYRLRDVYVGGASIALRQGKIVAPATILPDYRMCQLRLNPGLLPRPGRASVRQIGQLALVPATAWYWEWGHWWLEMAYRLYPLYRRIPEVMREATIVLPNDLPGWALESLRVAYGLEASQFTFYDRRSEVVFCRSALLPSIAFHHPDVNGFFDLLVRRCAGLPGPTVENGLLFLSRRLIQSSRRGCAMLANTAEVEALAAGMGFTVLSPEQLDWKQQVSLLARSRVVVGEHGSAMKSLLFAPSGTIGIVLNYLNESQTAVAALRGQRYVCLTADGYDAQEPQHVYSADERKLRRVLEIALAQAPPQHISKS